jgi:hypothetical protein
LNKRIHQCQLTWNTSTSQGAYLCRIEGNYKQFGEDNTTLEHERL